MDTVKLAIESGSPYVLYNLINKPLKLPMVKPVVEYLHKYGVWVEGYFVIGMREKLMNTVRKQYSL